MSGLGFSFMVLILVLRFYSLRKWEGFSLSLPQALALVGSERRSHDASALLSKPLVGNSEVVNSSSSAGAATEEGSSVSLSIDETVVHKWNLHLIHVSDFRWTAYTVVFYVLVTLFSHCKCLLLGMTILLFRLYITFLVLSSFSGWQTN